MPVSSNGKDLFQFWTTNPESTKNICYYSNLCNKNVIKQTYFHEKKVQDLLFDLMNLHCDKK